MFEREIQQVPDFIGDMDLGVRLIHIVFFWQEVQIYSQENRIMAERLTSVFGRHPTIRDLAWTWMVRRNGGWKSFWATMPQEAMSFFRENIRNEHFIVWQMAMSQHDAVHHHCVMQDICHSPSADESMLHYAKETAFIMRHRINPIIGK